MVLGQQEKTIYLLLIKGRARVHITPIFYSFLAQIYLPQRDSTFLGFKGCLYGLAEKESSLSPYVALTNQPYLSR